MEKLSFEEISKMLLGKHANLGVAAATQSDGRMVFRMPERNDSGLAAIATHAWRAKTKMVDASTGEPKAEYSKIYRHIEGVLAGLKEIGLEIVDPTGKPYDTGMAFNPIAFEPMDGISKEEIIETIRPSIFWNTLHIQIGEIIVGTPKK